MLEYETKCMYETLLSMGNSISLFPSKYNFFVCVLTNIPSLMTAFWVIKSRYSEVTSPLFLGLHARISHTFKKGILLPIVHQRVRSLRVQGLFHPIGLPIPSDIRAPIEAVVKPLGPSQSMPGTRGTFSCNPRRSPTRDIVSFGRP